MMEAKKRSAEVAKEIASKATRHTKRDTVTETVADTAEGKTIAELKQFYNDYSREQKAFAAATDALQLVDLTKSQTRSFTVFNKELLRNYLRNPKSNEKNLRNLSNFLWRVCETYRRIITHQAEMINLGFRSLIPMIDPASGTFGSGNPEEDKKLMMETGLQLRKMNLESEIYKCALICWREDTFYGYTYEDDQGFFIMPLEGEYCKVSSVNYDGTLNFAFDFSYFRKHKECLEYWDKEFQTKFNQYDTGGNEFRWQELDLQREICFKINIEDMTMDLPPYIALFEMLIDLIDLQSIQSVKDELSIYKLLVANLETRNNADDSDQFKVDIDLAIEYYKKMEANLPDTVASTISLLPINPVEFKGNTTEDVDMIASAEQNVLNRAGCSQLLGTEHTGNTIYEAQILADTNHALTVILPQIEKRVNRYLTDFMGDHFYVKYLKVSPITAPARKKQLLESAQNAIPVKLAVATLDGLDVLDTLALDYLENDVLKLGENWTPLSNSYVQSGKEGAPGQGGGQEKDTGDLTDAGSKSKDKKK